MDSANINHQARLAIKKPESGFIATLLVVVLLWGAGSVADPIIPRPHRVKPTHTAVDATRSRLDVITVKFRDGLLIRLRDGRLTDLGTGALREAGLVLTGAAAGRWERTHSLPEAKLGRLRQTAQKNLGKAVADLNLQFNLFLPLGADPSATIDALNALEIVEIALPFPLPVLPAGVPNFEASQVYLGEAPVGVGADCVWQLPGGAGAGIKVADIEFSWNLAHEDLRSATVLGLEPWDPFGDDNHGTAILGQFSSLNNGWGTTGIAFDSAVYVLGAFTAGGMDVGAAITTALDTLSAGDVIVIPLQASGPCGLVPVEWEEPWYNAIQTAVGVGVIVVEAAANDSQDLDSPCYNVGHAPFLPENDSGAFIVGAGASPGGSDVDRSRLGFSGYGSTVDLQASGENIYTTGYGDAYDADGKNLLYTSSFYGTSSASAIVAGVCLLVQAAHKEATGSFLTPAQLKNYLQATGTPQQAGTFPVTQNIGPRPNAAAALIASGAAQDTNSNGVPDCCDNRGCLPCTTLFANSPPNCAIDARQPSTIDGVTQQGWNSMEVLVGPSGCLLTQTDITIEALPTGPTPHLDGIAQVDDVATITFEGIIPKENWTCVSLMSNATQQACIGFLPGDVDSDGTSNPALDLGALIDCINKPGSCAAWQENIARTGAGAGVLDITRLIDLFNGAGSYESITGASFGAQACPSDLACSSNSQCDGGDLCTSIECVEGECVATPMDCPPGAPCDPSDGICKECLTDADCPTEQVCDPSSNSCVDCLDHPNCDDGLACTEDICDPSNACSNTPQSSRCNDGDACNGVETCDATLGCQEGTPLVCDGGDLCTSMECVEGECVATPVDCPPGTPCDPSDGICKECLTGTDCPPEQVCDPSSNSCVDCLDHPDCDDGLFCNGQESCDVAASTCVAGTNPCAIGAVCDDELDECRDETRTVTLTDGDSYDFSEGVFGRFTGGDFYFSSQGFWANNIGQRGTQDMGNLRNIPLTAVDIPEFGYTRFALAVVGHTFVSLAQEGEEGDFIVFRVTQIDDLEQRVTLEYVIRRTVTLGNQDSYDFSEGVFGHLSGGDFYFSSQGFWANNIGQRGTQDMGNLGNIPLTAIDIPEVGYTRFGTPAVVGHTFVSLAQEGEEGDFIVFRVTQIDDLEQRVTLEYVIRQR